VVAAVAHLDRLNCGESGGFYHLGHSWRVLLFVGNQVK
jgi:hypothetical protein